MGRHSAADDDSADEPVATTATLDLGGIRGRHTRRDDEDAAAQDEQHTQMITIIDSDVQVDDVQETGVLPPVPAAKPPKPPKAPKAPKKKREGESNTQADLRLLRESTAVRAQVLAAVIVSFALYTVVMIVIGKTSSYVMWIWIPIVVAGVGVGTVLDAAHRRAKRAAAEPVAAEPVAAEPPAEDPPPSQE